MIKFIKNYSKSRKLRMLLLVMTDLIFITIASYISLLIATNFELNSEFLSYRKILLDNMVYHSIIVIVSFYLFGLYRSLWQYASVREMLAIVCSSIFAMTIGSFIFLMLNQILPPNFYVINTFLTVVAASITRLSYRLVRVFQIYYTTKKGTILKSKNSKVAIIGAGEAGVLAAREIMQNAESDKIVVGFLDDDYKKIGRKVMGLPVLGRIDEIEAIMENVEINEVVFAIASMSKLRRREILEKYKYLNIELNIIPPLYEIIDGKIELGAIRKVKIEDLLGREPISLENPEIRKYIEGKTVMVTGGGGSIGSELSRQIAKFNPALLIIFDIYENSAYDIQNELKRRYENKLNLKVLIGSVRDEVRLEEVFKTYRPNFVFHAAAHKHVPLMQDSPFEAIKNNSIGTIKTADMAGKYGAERFLLISTDKAVNPTNIMGASKRLAELGLQKLNKKYENTELMAVRFGNVLGSNGSVIPLFERQIVAGGPVTVTHPDVIRYFMTIPEAVELVLKAGSMAMGGEVFVLDMGDPVKIVDLARDLIRLSGFEPYEEIDIQFVGLRPGEKLYEELLLDEENLKRTPYKKIFVVGQLDMELEYLEKMFKEINEAVKNKDLNCLEDCIVDLIPHYRRINMATE